MFCTLSVAVLDGMAASGQLGGIIFGIGPQCLFSRFRSIGVRIAGFIEFVGRWFLARGPTFVLFFVLMRFHPIVLEVGVDVLFIVYFSQFFEEGIAFFANADELGYLGV